MPFHITTSHLTYSTEHIYSICIFENMRQKDYWGIIEFEDLPNHLGSKQSKQNVYAILAVKTLCSDGIRAGNHPDYGQENYPRQNNYLHFRPITTFFLIENLVLVTTEVHIRDRCADIDRAHINTIWGYINYLMYWFNFSFEKRYNNFKVLHYVALLRWRSYLD